MARPPPLARWTGHRVGARDSGRAAPAPRGRLPRVLAGGPQLRDGRAALPRLAARCPAAQVPAVRGHGLHPARAVLPARGRHPDVVAQPRPVGGRGRADAADRRAHLAGSHSLPGAAGARVHPQRPVLPRQLSSRPDERGDVRPGPARDQGVSGRTRCDFGGRVRRRDGAQDHAHLLHRVARDPRSPSRGARRVSDRPRVPARAHGPQGSFPGRGRAAGVLPQVSPAASARGDRVVHGGTEHRRRGEPDDARARVSGPAFLPVGCRPPGGRRSSPTKARGSPCWSCFWAGWCSCACAGRRSTPTSWP